MSIEQTFKLRLHVKCPSCNNTVAYKLNVTHCGTAVDNPVNCPICEVPLTIMATVRTIVKERREDER